MATIVVDEQNSRLLVNMSPLEFSTTKRVLDEGGVTRLSQLFAAFISQNATIQREQDVERVKRFVENATAEKLSAMLAIVART